MAVCRWKGSAQSIAQVNTATVGGTPANGQVYSVTMGLNSSKVVSYTASGVDTNSTIAAALQALLAASTIPEFREVAWTVNGAVITGTGRIAGYPFSFSSSATGPGTLTTATTTAATGPNFWSNAANWSGNAVPVSSDDVYLENSAVSVLYDIDQHTVALNSLNVASTFTGSIGLAETNANGYLEYRGQFLQIGATTVNVGDGNSQGQGSGRIKLDSGSTTAVTLNVRLTGSPAEQTVESLQWKGTNAGNSINLLRGSMAIAGYAGDVATVSSLRVGYISSQQSDASLRCGSGLTLTTLKQEGGTVEVNSAVTTATATAGTLTVKGSGAITTLTADGGSVVDMGSGTTGTLSVGIAGSVDFSQSVVTKHVTNCTLSAGATVKDAFGRVVWDNPITLSQCDLSAVSLSVGVGKTILPA